MSKILGHWEELKGIAGALGGDLKLVYTKDSYGKETNKVVIEYKVEKAQ
tara:strand:+ start:461 stop:607 length:147 start_codon:yes stop_codon:yes gene_type:complete